MARAVFIREMDGAGALQQPFFLTRRNFVTADGPLVPEGTQWTFFTFFFDRGDVCSKQSSECSFGNLPRELKVVLKMLVYAAHSCDGTRVFLLYMEPSVAEVGESLGLYLRCQLTTEFCLVFAVPSQLREGGGLFFEEPESGNAWLQGCLVKSAKRLICVDHNLVGTTAAYIMRNDPEKTDALLECFDFDHWRYHPDVMTRKPKWGRFNMDKQLLVTDTTLTKNSLLSAVSLYFKGSISKDCNLGTNEVLEFMFANMGIPDKSALYRRFRIRNGGSAAVTFLDELGEGRVPEVRGALLFEYSMEHLLNKDNFLLFETAPFLTYRNLSANREECIEKTVHQMGTEDNNPHEDFRLTWPHLHSFKMICDEVSAGSPAEVLRLKVCLFSSVVLNNAAKINTEPAKGIYTKLSQLMSRGVFSMVGCGESPPGCRDPSCCPRRADCRFLKTVFGDVFGLGRMGQAYLSMVHILHTTAPKWKPNRIMLVNHTRGGTGKSHTVGVLKRLFQRVQGLFGGLSSLTDTVFKYSEMSVGKVMIMDDVGLSQSQQKNSKREDTMLAAQFKSLLDVGYTNNAVTEKNVKTGAFRVETKVAVCNSCFMWNTNTMDTFSSAWTDRCVVLGAEPLKEPLRAKPVTEIDRKFCEQRLDERFQGMFLRQHVLQTLIYVCCPEDASPGSPLFNFVKRLTTLLERRFPVVRDESSMLRSEFKLMDLVMGETVRMAVSAVLDWWVPPWTCLPEGPPDETCGQFVARINKARYRAFKCVDLPEVMVEVMAQAKAFGPSSATQMVANTFSQSTSQVLHAVLKLIESCLKATSRDVFSGEAASEDNILIISQVPRFSPESLQSDVKVLLAGRNLTFKEESGREARLVHEVLPQQGQVKLGGFFTMELLKLCAPERLLRLKEQFTAVFRDQLEMGDRLRPVQCPPQVDLEGKNTLRMLTLINSDSSPNTPELVVSEGDVLVAPHFMGIATELFAEGDWPAASFTGYLYTTYHGGDHRMQAQSPEQVRDAWQMMKPKIHWFDAEYLNRAAAGMYSHSRCGMVPRGNHVEFYGDCAPEQSLGDTFEYDEAAAVYSKYLKRCHTREELVADLTRYAFHVNAADSPAAEDPHLSRLREELPSTLAQSAALLEARYGRSLSAINDQVSHRRKRHAAEAELDEPEFEVKTFLTRGASELLERLKMAARRQQTDE